MAVKSERAMDEGVFEPDLASGVVEGEGVLENVCVNKEDEVDSMIGQNQEVTQKTSTVVEPKTILEARDVSKKFFRKTRESAQYFDAVCPTTLALHPGELVVLKGRSGSGKSTLLNMMAGLLEPSEGTVELGDVDLYALPDTQLSQVRNESIGVIPQGHTLIHSLTAVQNVTLPYLMYRADDGIEARALELLDMLGMRGLADSYPSELSGGEVRRVAVARALVCTPAVILADEPTGDLDDENTSVVLQALRDAADAGAAVLLVTHEQAADSYADRVLRLDAGELVATEDTCI